MVAGIHKRIVNIIRTAAKAVESLLFFIKFFITSLP